MAVAVVGGGQAQVRVRARGTAAATRPVVRTVLQRRRLAVVLRKLLHTSVPASLAFYACEDPGAIEETVRVRSDQAPYADLVAACRADDAACDPLCEKILAAEGEDPTWVTLEECRFRDIAAGVAEVELTYSYPPEACGRRPAGWSPAAGRDGASLGAHLARCAELEEVSVHAFLRLAGELDAIGAPAALAAAARGAAADEVRHAALVGGLARALGAEPPPVQVAAPAARSLGAIAEENAAEGCVREAFGALLATWQAVHAADPLVAAAWSIIAPDERRHARLARAVDRFLAPRLTRSEARRVADARRAALADLGVPEAHPLALRLL
jgi:hypothetical protein